MRLRAVFILLSLIILVGFLAYRIELAFPGTAPSIQHLYASHATARNWLYDVLGYAVTKDEAKLLQTDEGRNQLSPERGAVAVTEKLALGREAFYTETFGNEVFFTEVTGILDGPLNIGNLTKAIAALGGKHHKPPPVDRDVTSQIAPSKQVPYSIPDWTYQPAPSCHWEYKPTSATVKFESLARRAMPLLINKPGAFLREHHRP